MTTINLRLSPSLEAKARARSDDLGISINAFVSVAVDSYLTNGVVRVVPEITQLAASPGVVVDPVVPGKAFQKTTKKERQEYTAAARAQRKLPL